MKKLLLIVSAILIIAGCAKKSDVEDLLNRVDELEGAKITSVEGQISNINKSISELQTAKDDIDGIIEGLQKKDGAIESACQGLGQDIKDLKDYADGLSESNVSWAEATFSTLQMMSQVQTRLETLEKLEPELKTALTDVETNVKKWVGVQLEGYATLTKLEASIVASEAKAKGWIDDVDTTAAHLRNDLDTAKEQLEQGYKDAIKTAIEEYSGEVTKEIADKIKDADDAIADDITALQGKVDGLEDRVKDAEDALTEISSQISDINDSIEEAETAISEMEKSFGEKLAAAEADIIKLKRDLDTAKSQLVSACETAIKTALDDYAGEVTDEITDKIDAAKQEIGTQIDSIKGRLTSLEGKMTAAETKIAGFIGRIQSIAAVPSLSDGSVEVSTHQPTTVRFEVSPVSAAKALVESAGTTAFFRFQAVEVRTKAGSESNFITFTVQSVNMDSAGEFVEVTVLPNTEFTEDSHYVARLKIEANENTGSYVCKTSEYFPLTPNSKTPQNMSFSSPIVNWTIGIDCYINVAKNPQFVLGAKTAVTCTSSHPDVAKIENGKIVVKRAGTTTITASAAENEVYQAGSASYELIISE